MIQVYENCKECGNDTFRIWTGASFVAYKCCKCGKEDHYDI